MAAAFNGAVTRFHSSESIGVAENNKEKVKENPSLDNQIYHYNLAAVSAIPHAALKRRAFSLIELLAVMAIFSVMASLTVPALNALMSGRDLSRALEVTLGVTATARQQAISSGATVVLFLNDSTGADGKNSSQAFMLLKAGQSEGEWTAVSPWMKLPETIRLSPHTRDGDSTFYSQAPADSQIPALPNEVNGRSLANSTYIVFRPDGSVSAPAIGPALELRRTQKSGVDADYVVLIQEDSGRTKITAL